MLTTIQSLKTILNTVSASLLPNGFEYIETMPTSFPAGVILSLGGEEKPIDCITDEVTEQFVIKLIFPMQESQASTEKWLTLADTITATFRKDDYQTLSGTAVYFRVKSFSPPTPSSDYTTPVITIDIAVEAKIVKLNNT